MRKIIPFGRFTQKELIEGEMYYGKISLEDFERSEGEQGDLGWWRAWLCISGFFSLIGMLGLIPREGTGERVTWLFCASFCVVYACWCKSREHKLIVFLRRKQQREGMY